METNKQKAYKEALAKGDVMKAILIAQNKSSVVILKPAIKKEKHVADKKEEAPVIKKKKYSKK